MGVGGDVGFRSNTYTILSLLSYIYIDISFGRSYMGGVLE